MKSRYIFLIIIVILILVLSAGYLLLKKENTSTISEINCEENIYNCDDFVLQSEAQDVLEECGVELDIHALDKDGNGLACESLG